MKLITWNVQWCRGLDGRVDPRRIVEHAKRLADFDVLCLQEVAAHFDDLPGSAGENQFASFAELLPEYTAIPGAAIDLARDGGGRQAFGNMILSRYPVLAVSRTQLPSPPQQGRPSMPRMLLDARLDTPLGLVRVMTTHLEYYSDRQRAAQVEAIRRHHAEACGWAAIDGLPGKQTGPFRRVPQTASAILTADFNFKPDDPLHARLQDSNGAASRFVDVWEHRHPGSPHPLTLGVHDRKQWPQPLSCDFIYATEDLLPHLTQVAVDGESTASDHQPVLAVFDTLFKNKE